MMKLIVSQKAANETAKSDWGLVGRLDQQRCIYWSRADSTTSGRIVSLMLRHPLEPTISINLFAARTKISLHMICAWTWVNPILRPLGGSRLALQFNVNVIGVIFTINAFLPLLKRGTTKKVITLSNPAGHPEFPRGQMAWTFALCHLQSRW